MCLSEARPVEFYSMFRISSLEYFEETIYSIPKQVDIGELHTLCDFHKSFPIPTKSCFGYLAMSICSITFGLYILRGLE